MDHLRFRQSQIAAFQLPGDHGNPIAFAVHGRHCWLLYPGRLQQCQMIEGLPLKPGPAVSVFEHCTRIEVSPDASFLNLFTKVGILAETLSVAALSAGSLQDDRVPHLVNGHFFSFAGKTLVLSHLDRFSIQISDPETGEVLFVWHSEKELAFWFQKCRYDPSLDCLVATGHFYSEGKDSVIAVPWSKLVATKQPRISRVDLLAYPNDYAYGIAMGANTKGEVVFYRDPEDDVEGDHPPIPALAGFKGFYWKGDPGGPELVRVPTEGNIPFNSDLKQVGQWMLAHNATEMAIQQIQSPFEPLVWLEVPYAIDPCLNRLHLLQNGHLAVYDLLRLA